MAGMAVSRYVWLVRDVVPARLHPVYSKSCAFGSIAPDFDLVWTSAVVAITLDRTWVDLVRSRRLLRGQPGFPNMYWGINHV